MPTEQWVTNKIEALEQAHAELAARMDAWVDVANDHKDKMSESVHAIKEQQSDLSNRLGLIELNALSNRFAALESPAPAPDPVCQCGHEAKWHNDHKRKCNHVESLRPYVRCECEAFVPTAEPEPAPLDPQTILQKIYRYGNYRMQFGMSTERGTEQENAEDNRALAEQVMGEIETAIRAYAQDGAR